MGQRSWEDQGVRRQSWDKLGVKARGWSQEGLGTSGAGAGKSQEAAQKLERSWVAVRKRRGRENHGAVEREEWTGKPGGWARELGWAGEPG